MAERPEKGVCVCVSVTQLGIKGLVVSLYRIITAGDSTVKQEGTIFKTLLMPGECRNSPLWRQFCWES